MRIIIAAAALWLVPCVPLLAADTVTYLRCEARGEITFSVSIDPIARAVPQRGVRHESRDRAVFNSVIEATSKEVTPLFRTSSLTVSPANFSYRGVQRNRATRGAVIRVAALPRAGFSQFQTPAAFGVGPRPIQSPKNFLNRFLFQTFRPELSRCPWSVGGAATR